MSQLSRRCRCDFQHTHFLPNKNSLSKIELNSRGSKRGRGRARQPTRSDSSNNFCTTVERGQTRYNSEKRPQMVYSTSRSTANLSVNQMSRVSSTNSFRSFNHEPIVENEILPLAMRPDPGGKAGRKLNVITNHFACYLPENLTVFHYDVELAQQTPNKQWHSVNKESRMTIFREIIRREPLPTVWYDESEALYSTKELDYLKAEYMLDVQDDPFGSHKSYRFLIKKLVKTYEIQPIYDFLNGKMSIRPRDPVRVLEILLKQTPRETMICNKDQFFAEGQTMEALGDGRSLATGFYQALSLTKAGLTLNLNTKYTCFYSSQPIIDYINEILCRDITVTGLAREERLRLLHEHLKPLLVQTSHTQSIRKYRIRDFSSSAMQHKFSILTENDENSARRETTIYEYFKTKYNITLKYPHLPTLELYTMSSVKMPHFLPMECCEICPWQRCIKSTTIAQRTRISRKTVVPVEKRWNMIQKIVHERRFEVDPYLCAVGMGIDLNMLELEARCIEPPEIIYRSSHNGEEVSGKISIGKWSLRNHLFSPRSINRWAITLLSSVKPNQRQLHNVETFIHSFQTRLESYGIQFQSNPMLLNIRADVNSLNDTMRNFKEYECDFILFILNNVGDEIYKEIKNLGNQKIGIVTQCTDFAAIEKNIRDHKIEMYLENLVQKLNAKLGGINSTVSLTRALTHTHTRDDIFMFFGADVTHAGSSSEKSSIAAVVGSIDSTCTQYASRLSEQTSQDGRSSVELITDLYTMVTDLLKLYGQRNGVLPNKIVFYRDGVDDGFFQTVLNKEVRTLKNATRALYMNNPLPSITFIVVKKRHNTRFFLRNANGYISNVSPGTIIDTGIVHPHQFDFYLNSHSALQGTSHPCHYHVLYDEIGFSSDEIQALTYYLCHTDVRCTKAVSIPAPIHYAHLAAYQSRNIDSSINTNNRPTASIDINEDDYEFDIEEITTKLIQLDPSVKDSMWFV